MRPKTQAHQNCQVRTFHMHSEGSTWYFTVWHWWKKTSWFLDWAGVVSTSITDDAVTQSQQNPAFVCVLHSLKDVVSNHVINCTYETTSTQRISLTVFEIDNTTTNFLSYSASSSPQTNISIIPVHVQIEKKQIHKLRRRFNLKRESNLHLHNMRNPYHHTQRKWTWRCAQDIQKMSPFITHCDPSVPVNNLFMVQLSS